MMNIFRIQQKISHAGTMRLEAIALIALLAGPAVGQSPATLRIERNEAGSIIQAIQVDHWSYDAARGVLKVTSTDGNRRCGYAGGLKGSTGRTLELDGVSYPLEKLNVRRKGRATITVQPSFIGLFPSCMPHSGSSAGYARALKGSTGLNLRLDALGTSAPLDVPGAGQAVYQPSPADSQLSAVLAGDAICLQSGTDLLQDFLYTFFHRDILHKVFKIR